MSNINNTTKEEEDDALLEAFSPIVNKLIDKNFESSQEKIALQIAPLIGGAIREQIKSQKDDVVDALYPVLGNMIGRYVTKTLEETLNTINQQIQNGLSFEALSRKLRAKIKGVSETELLLNESSSSNIRAILLIHKETGIILAEANNPDAPLQEPEMVASMMSAIKSFVNDWIDKNESHNEIGEIEYGGNKIILENSGYSYLAVIVDGATYAKTYKDIQTTLEYIVVNHGNEIKKFNGDLSTFSNMDIYTTISSLLRESPKEDKKVKKTHPLMYIIPSIILAFFSWKLYTNYIDDAISSLAKEKIYANEQLALYKIGIDTTDQVLTLSGNVPFLYHKNLVETLVNDSNIKSIKNDILVVSTTQDPMQVSSNISYLLNGLNSHNGINIDYTYNYPNLEITGETWDEERKEQVIKQISKIKNIKDMYFKIDIIPPNIKEIIYFKNGSYSIDDEVYNKLLNLSKTLNSLDDKTIITIQAYSDESGSLLANKNIVDKRAYTVYDALKNKLHISQEINSVSHYNAPKDINVTLTPEKARCAIISIEK